MTQELADLKTSIIEGRYQDALAIVDELEGMSKKAILRNIQSFLKILMIHFIKNQVQQRLTNSWAASIQNSLEEINSLNRKDNKTSYYINAGEWQPFLEEAIEAAIRPASLEIYNKPINRAKFAAELDQNQLIAIASRFLELTYSYTAKDLPAIIDEQLSQLPGGEDWNQDDD
ncbi:DUF29 family protein [[Phormidium] sp. ETS-05]|uniref:DUF29 family protein n=1 Tax=[Phormidium] sp. ETS-05 TaxID=222819 RepID=UPI0018EF1608|nr:DUF29 family protein [[Phormidium] sp. ETS-05]